MNNRKLLRYMLKIFISFFFAVGIPVAILTGYMTHTFVENQKKQQQTGYQSFITDEIEHISMFIRSSLEIRNAIFQSDHFSEVQNNLYKNSVYSYRQLLDLMTSYKNSNTDFTSDCSLYIENSQKVLSTQCTISNFCDFEDKDVIDDFIKSKQRMRYLQKDHFLIIGSTKPVFYYDDSSVFLFYLDMDEIFDKVESDQYIFSKDGRLVYADGPLSGNGEELWKLVQTRDDEEYVELSGYRLWFAQEPYSDLLIMHAYDSSNNKGTVLQTYFLAIVLVASSLFFTCLCAFLMTKVHTHPVALLSEQIEKMPMINSEDEDTIFGVISRSLDELKNLNSEYLASIQQNQKIMQERAIDELIWNRVDPKCNVELFLKDNGFDNTPSVVTPLLVNIGSRAGNAQFESVAEINSLVREIIRDGMGQYGLVGSSQIETDQIVFLFGDLEQATNQNVRERMDSIIGLIFDHTHIEVKAILGYSVCNAESLYQEFVALRKQLYQFASNKNLRRMKTINKTRDYLSPYLRASLLNAVQSGEQALVEKALVSIYDTVAGIRDKEMAKNYELAVVGNVLSHLLDSPITVPVSKLNLADAFEANVSETERQRIFLERFQDIALYFKKETASDSDCRYIAAAREYIERNYVRDLSISEISQYLGINVSYFSRIFKSSMDITPLQYVTQLRVEKAKELLTDNGLTIREIAESVGYNDVRSFVRFFKKLEGYSPSEFRERLQRER